MYVAYSYAQVWSACMEVFAVKGRKLSWHVSDRNGACMKFDFVMRFHVVFVYSTSMQIYPHESFTVWTKNECGKFRKFSVTNFRKPRGVILFSGNNRKYRSICPFRKFRRKVSVLWNILRIVYRFNRNTTVQKKKVFRFEMENCKCLQTRSYTFLESEKINHYSVSAFNTRW